MPRGGSICPDYLGQFGQDYLGQFHRNLQWSTTTQISGRFNADYFLLACIRYLFLFFKPKVSYSSI